MWSTVTTAPMVEARERMNILSTLEEVRGIAEPDRQMLLDTLSGVLALEQGTGKLYWHYTQQTGSQELRAQWQKFGKETEVHRLITERAINAMGGDPSYKSSTARDIERSFDCLTNIESQGCAGDHIRLGNLVMAETVGKLHWKGMFKIARSVKDPATAKIFWDAARIVAPDKEEHVEWNAAMYESCLETLSLGI